MSSDARLKQRVLDVRVESGDKIIEVGASRHSGTCLACKKQFKQKKLEVLPEDNFQ